MDERLQRRQARRQRLRRNRQLQGTYLTLLLFGLILLFGVLHLITPDRAYSEDENRMLAQWPAPTWSSLRDGTYTDALERYFADQFPARDGWIGLKLRFDRATGQKEANGVYLCSDDYLMQIPTAPNEETLDRTLTAIDRFAAQYPSVNTVVSIVPNAVTILSEKLPKNAPVRDRSADLQAIYAKLDGVKKVDVTQTLLAHKDETLYYRTDHHWTSLGAKLAFETIAPALDITPIEDYSVYTVSDSFEGTLASKSGCHGATDVIEVYAPQSDVAYAVTYDDSHKTVCSLYDAAALKEKDQYTVFFGGNHPQIDIETGADTGKTLLIFKDSYANCFVQFLTPYYDRIVMIDARYYYDNVSSIMRREGVTDVLFLYNLDTFQDDVSLADVLEASADAQ